MSREVQLYVGDALGRYGFPHGHPFGPDRQDAFWREAENQGLPKRVELCEPRQALVVACGHQQRRLRSRARTEVRRHQSDITQ